MELLAFFLLYFGLTFVWRSVVVYRKTGINPFVLGKGDDAYGYVGRAFKLTIMLIASFVLMRAFWPASIQELGTFGALQTPTWTALGWVLMGLSLVIMLVAQAQMGLSWRIGIDEKNRTGLVTQGLFALSRNPIFLSLRITLLGLFFHSPNALTLALASVGEVLMQLQVRLEEQHLLGQHGEVYVTYCQKVRRWI
jgi:protein-S-isoprenylcysteine O-methyltransferase Ste14